MPQLGETVAEGKITKWFKSAGDAVKPGDNLFEIETDKMSMEVPATSAGVLTEINVQVGEVAKVGAVVAVISGAGEAPAQRSRRRRSVAPLLPAKAGPGPRRVAAAPVERQTIVQIQAIRPDGPVLRGAHAGAQLRSGEAAERHVRHAAGAAACRRARHRPVARQRLRPARPHRRGDVEAAIASGAGRAAAPAMAPAHRRRRSRRSTRASTTRKCRSTACARPSRRA